MEEEDKVEQSLMINPLNVPEEKFTADGKSYYYTRGDGTPITDDSWSLKDLAYPLNVPFGGKKQGNLSDWAFTNWLLNTAPSQIAPIGAGIKGIKTIRKQSRQSPHGFYKEGSIDAKPNYKDIIQDVLNHKNTGNAVKPSFELMGTNPTDTSRQIPKYAQSAKIYLGDQPPISTFMTTTGGDDDLVPEWFFSQKGTQFEDTSDAEGLNKPPGLDPKQERDWYAKLTYQRVLNEVLRQGGTKLEAQQLFAEKRDFFEPLIDKRTGERKGKGIVATITELNNMMDKWSPGIQVRTTPSVKDGVEIYRYQFKDVDGRFTTWDLERKKVDELVNYSKTTFAKDHLSPVKDRSRIGGGYYGADNPGNFEILYQFVNTQKSNKTQLPKGLLKEMGVPGSLSEWVNMRLYPQNYEGMFVPQRWKENFQKIVLAEYYEKTKGLKSANKRKAVMDKLVSTWSAFFKDPEIVRGLEMLEEALGQQVAKNMEEGVAAGNEVPAWLGLLQKPPGGWNSKDPWWTSLSKDAQIRYKYIYDYNQRTIKPYKRSPQGTKDYEI